MIRIPIKRIGSRRRRPDGRPRTKKGWRPDGTLAQPGFGVFCAFYGFFSRLAGPSKTGISGAIFLILPPRLTSMNLWRGPAARLALLVLARGVWADRRPT